MTTVAPAPAAEAAVEASGGSPPDAPGRSIPDGLWSALVGVVVIGIWELSARTVLEGSYALAPPTAVLREIGENADLYRRNLTHTIVNAWWGFLWGNLVAIALAALASLAPPLRRSINAVCLTTFCLPLIALAPILRVVLGPGESTPITLAALAVFFTTFVAALLGFDSAPAGALGVVRSYGRGRLAAFAAVRLRASVPAMFAGLQIAAPAAFLGALVGEFTGSSSGFGILTIQALRTLETDKVWAVAVLSTLVSSGAYLAIGWLGRRLCPWAAAIDVSAAPAEPPPRSLAQRAIALLAPLAAVLALWMGFLWYFEVDSFFAKTPVDVWRDLVTGPDAAEMRSTVFPPLWSTVWTTALGFVAGIVSAVVLAALFVLAPWLERSLMPIAVSLRAVPIIATTPVIILILGRDVIATVMIVAVMSFFPTLVNCVAAMRRTPIGILEVLHSYDAGSVAQVRLAHLPAAVPALLASARIAVPTSLLGATVAEWLATGDGMGNLMTVAANTARYDVLWVSVALLTIVAVAGYLAVAAFETRVLARMAPERTR
jgi:sulfonate transport system permease protein